MRLALLAALAATSAACHYRATPVPMQGDRGAIAALAGTWSGTYRGTESGRSGNISFTIRVNGDSAFGDVVMGVPSGLPRIQPADDPAAHRAHAANPRSLAVRFVALVGDEVEGALEPYLAPDCDCTVRTVFNGIVRGDTVRGTFVTRGSLVSPQTGVWSAVRTRDR